MFFLMLGFVVGGATVKRSTSICNFVIIRTGTTSVYLSIKFCIYRGCSTIKVKAVCYFGLRIALYAEKKNGFAVLGHCL